MSHTVRFPRAEHGGLLLGLTLSQLVLTGLALPLAAMAAFANLGVLPSTGLGFAGAVLLLVAFTRVEGHPGHRWVLLRGAFGIRGVRRQTRYRARPQRPAAAGTLGLPGTAASLQLLQAPAGFAIVHDPHARTLIAVQRVAGTAFALLDSGEQDRRVSGWGRVLAGLCQGGRIARVQVLERTVPDAGDALARYADEHLTDDAWQVRMYRELLDDAAPVSERHEVYLAVSLDLAKTRRQARQAGGGLTGATALLHQETVSIDSALHAAGLTPSGWLTPREIASVLRSAYDPTAHPPPYTADPPSAQVTGPMAVDEHWDRLRSDSGVHAVYLVAEWPRVQVAADFLDPIVFTPGIRRCFTLLAQPVGVDRALKEIRRAKTQHVTDAAQRARLGQIEDETLTAEYRDVLAREADLVAGHGELRFVGLLAVTAPTREELEAACGQVETAAVQAMLDLRRLVGQQAEAFAAAALPLGRGLT